VAEPLRVAVLGAGRMGVYHVETLERIDAWTLVAVADPDEAVARAAIGRRPIDYDRDWSATLARDDLDAVIVATPTVTHVEIAGAALRAGLHVLVEKPIASTVSDGLRLVGEAREAGRKLTVGHVERFNPAVRKVREVLLEGRLGRIFRIEAVRVGPLPDRIRDAGVAIDLATHDLDLMQWILRREITRVSAEGTRFLHASEEDMITALLRFGADGPFGVLDVNWLTPEKRRELTLLGENGMLRADYLTQDVWYREAANQSTGWDELALVRGDAEGSILRFSLRKVEPLRAELEAFARCILEDTREPVSGYDGARALAVALAVRDSAHNNRPVTLLPMPIPAPAG
jgi:UDP-N-acetylglucosamine 3-dehydrogenase